MNTLWFVRMVNAEFDNIVFCLTEANEEAAKAAGLDMIAPEYRANFVVDRCEAICQTPDIVPCFEPV